MTRTEMLLLGLLVVTFLMNVGILSALIDVIDELRKINRRQDRLTKD